MFLENAMRHIFSVIIIFCIMDKVITEDDEGVIEETEVPDTTEDDNGEQDSVAVTEEIMNPNITMNEPGEEDEEEEEKAAEKESADHGFDANRAIRDLAYYLRAHKFHDFDRRYPTKSEDTRIRFYEDFPKPALRSMHWEAHKSCDSGFYSCLRHANEILLSTNLRREDDTVSVIRENKWDLKKNSKQIASIQEECKKAQKSENRTMKPFEGPIERFRWRTTMSYYMCWYTMLENPELEFFGDSCANHANCLDDFGIDNKDPRANDDKSFACAMYSFCPDHCCPIKHIWYMKDCFQSEGNPCYEENQASDRKCSVKREENRDLHALISNQINVTCHCKKKGFEWSSRFGICVDINECTRNLHKCNLKAGEICANLPGSFTCMCKLGYVFNKKSKKCVSNPDIIKAINPAKDDEPEPKVKTIFQKIVKAVTRSSAQKVFNGDQKLHIFFNAVYLLCLFT